MKRWESGDSYFLMFIGLLATISGFVGTYWPGIHGSFMAIKHLRRMHKMKHAFGGRSPKEQFVLISKVFCWIGPFLIFVGVTSLVVSLRK